MNFKKTRIAVAVSCIVLWLILWLTEPPFFHNPGLSNWIWDIWASLYTAMLFMLPFAAVGICIGWPRVPLYGVALATLVFWVIRQIAIIGVFDN